MNHKDFFPLLPYKVDPLYFASSSDYICRNQLNQLQTQNLKKFAKFYNIELTNSTSKINLVTDMFTSDLHHTLANIFGMAAIVDNGKLVVTGDSLYKAFPMWFPDVDTYFGQCTALDFQKKANTLLLKAWHDVVVANNKTAIGQSAKAAMHLILLYNMTMRNEEFSVDFLKSKPPGRKLNSHAMFSDMFAHHNFEGVPLIPSTQIELLPDFIEALEWLS